MKQTAVEWLLSVVSLSEDAWIEIEKYESKAKQMEKEQIIDAWDDGFVERQFSIESNAKQYYNETYKSE